MAKKPVVKNVDGSGSEEEQICGLIMPISAMGSYSSAHWSEVRQIFDTAVNKAGMKSQIVSDSFETDVIQSRIIHNLYDNPVVICDVSGLNPNVMFELGMRITFKKPVIVVTDDVSNIPFDTKVIGHLAYPPDLHYHKVGKFIDALSVKIEKLLEQSISGKFRSFIEEFGQFNVLQPTEVPVGSDKIILDELTALRNELRRGSFPNAKRTSARSGVTRWPTPKSNNPNDLSQNIVDFRVTLPSNYIADKGKISDRISTDIVMLKHVVGVGEDNLMDDTIKFSVRSRQNWSSDLIDEVVNIIGNHGGVILSIEFQ